MNDIKPDARPVALEQTRPVRGLVSPLAPEVDSGISAPPDDLQDVVAHFWRGAWDLETPHTTELLADPCVNLVFEFGDRSDARVVGVWRRLWTRTLEGKGRVVGAKLRAGASRAFLEVPAHHLADTISPLDTRARPANDRELSAWLRERRANIAEPDEVSLATAVVEHARSHPEIVSTAALADAAGLAPRVLQRLFREFVGASPKWVIRRYRLQEVAERMAAGRAENLADLAAELGYSDQAHLARDFKSVVGRPPSEVKARA